MKVRNIWIGALVLALLLTFTGCKQISSVINKVTNADSSESQTNEVNKHNAYINLYNELLDRFMRTLDDYQGEFGWDEQVVIEDDFDGFNLYSTTACDLLEQAMAFADKDPKDAQADAALKALDPLLSEYCQALTGAKKYYEDKNYVDDNYAKAQEYHDVIVGKYDALQEKLEAFLEAVDKMLKGQEEKELARYKEAGEMIHYHGLLCLIKARTMDVYLSDHQIDNSNVLNIDLDEFRPIYDEFVKAYSDYNGLVKGDANAGEEEGIMTLNSFNSTLSELKSSAAELINHLQNGETFSDATEDGTPENIESLTGTLLSDYNSWFV